LIFDCLTITGGIRNDHNLSNNKTFIFLLPVVSDTLILKLYAIPMNKGIWFIVVFSLFFSCKENRRSRDNSYQYYSVEVIPNSKLVLSPKINEDSTFRYYDYEVIEGASTVFTLTYTNGDSTYTDGGVAEIMVFEVDSSATDFDIVGADFNNHKALYKKACFCIDDHANKALSINSGKVSGRKINSTSWLLDASVGMIDFEDTVRVNQEKIISLK
jgi:hypothetical protein